MRPRTTAWIIAILALVGCGTGDATAPEASAIEFVTIALPASVDPTGAIAELQQRVLEGERRVAWLERLGVALAERAAEIEDGGLYHAVRQCALVIESEQVGATEAIFLHALALHGLHRFDEAEAVARRLVAQRGLAGDHGLLGDVLLDRGRLEEAAASYQHMLNLRPTARAYLRVARVRFLTGDIDGEAEALELAARASAHFSTTGARVRAEVIDHWLRRGDAASALALARIAADAAPDAAAARFSLGRALLANDRPTEAAAELALAAAQAPHPTTLWVWAEALREAGDPDAAARIEQKIVDSGGDEDPRATAVFLAWTGRSPARAVELARKELGQRTDAYTRAAMALSLHASGEAALAYQEAERGLASGLVDPTVQLQAALVAEAAGHGSRAVELSSGARAGVTALLPSERAALAALERRLAAG